MNILRKPLITEKASAGTKRSVYGFIVDRHSGKIEIKKEVESVYGVTVECVNTMSYSGKKKRRYTKTMVMKGRKSAYKKAFVKLKEGDVIDFYESSV